MMDLEKRERELKSLLDMAESLEERKKLRSELREIRQKMFEAPAADSKSTVQFKNAKNEMLTVVVGESGDRNNNLVTLKQSDDPPRTATEQQDSQKMADLEAERQEALRAKPAEERAARRARRAQHMNLLKKDKEESVDLPDSPKLARHTSSSSRLDSSSDEPGRGQPEIESTGAKKFGEVTITTSSADEEGVRKKETEDEEKGDSFPEKGKSVMTSKPPLKTPLGRSATWSGKEPLNASAQSKPASVTLGPARNKFDSQSTARATPSEPASPSKSLEPPQTDSVLYKRADPTPKRHHPSAPGLGAPAAGTVKKNASVSSRANIFQKAAEEEQAKIDKEKNQLAVRQNISKASSTSNLPEATKETEKKEDDKKTTAPCLKKREKKRPVRRTMSISSIVLDWVQEMVSDYEDYGVEVKNFSSSWNDGMAFCALIHKFNPDSFDFSLLRKENKRYNFELAFKTGLERKNIPILLDVEDMIRMEKPEPRSVQCYVQWIWSVYGPTSGYGPSMEEIKQAQVA